MAISLIAGCLFCWSQTKKMKRKVSLMGMKMILWAEEIAK